MPRDRARITRALEVIVATGRSLTEWHGEGTHPVLAGDQVIKIFLEVDQAQLYERIDARFEHMLTSGALREVEALARRGLDPALPAMKAHGVPWLIRCIEGQIDLAHAAAEAKRDTRRYTRRQRTWFRHQLPDWTWVAPESASEIILSELGRGRAGR